MKFLISIILILSTQLAIAESKNQSSSSKEQQVQQIMQDLNDLDEKEIEQIKRAVDIEVQRKYDERRSRKLGRILLNIRGLGKVRIENCNDLEVKGDFKEVETFKEELLDFCQQSLHGFWAELDATGILRFTYNTSESLNTKTINIGGGGDFSVSYKGHELLVSGNINDNEVGKEGSESYKRKLDSRVDYSLDILANNFKVFLMWHLNGEDATTMKVDSKTTSGFQRQILSTGLRYDIIKGKDFLNISFGLGGGLSFRDAYGSTSLPYPATWSPSIISTLDVSLKPSKNLSFVSNGRVQRDFHAFNPSWVASQSFGMEVLIKKGITIGTRFNVDWDDYRTYAGVENFGYSGMFTLGVNLADLIGDKEKREARRKERDREKTVWQNANNFANQEQIKKQAELAKSYFKFLFGF